MNNRQLIPFVLLLSTLLFGVLFKSPWLSFFSVIFLFWIFVIYLKLCAPPYILLLGFIFIRATEMFSGVLIESGGYLTETDYIGKPINAFVFLSFYYFVFFSTITFFSINKNIFRVINPPKINIGSFQVVIALSFCLVVLLLGVMAGLKDGFSYFLGVNRFTFRSTASISFYLSFFLNNRYLAIIILGALFAFSVSSFLKWGSFFISLCIVACSFFHGEQFTAMVSFILAFVISSFLSSSSMGKDVSVKIALVSIVSLIFGAVALVAVYQVQNYNIQEILSQRFLLQGQLWYATYADITDLFRWDAFERNIPSFFLMDVDSFTNGMIPYGMRELMYYYATDEVYNRYMEFNVTFTMGQMSMLLYWFGYIGMVIPIIMSAVALCYVLRYLYCAILSFDIISIVLSSKLYIWFVFGLQQGEYWYLFGLKTVIFVVFCYLFEKIRSSFSKKRALLVREVVET